MTVAFEALLQYALWMSGGRLQVYGLVRGVVAAAPAAAFAEHFARLHARLVEDAWRWDVDVELGRLHAVLLASPRAGAAEPPAGREGLLRVQGMQWLMKRACLMRRLLHLPVEPRAAWVLVTRLGAEVDGAGALLRVPASEVEARLETARALLDELLGGFCEHVDAANPCRCADRLGPALRAGLIRGDASPLLPQQAHDVCRGLPLEELYESLPARDLESAASRAAVGAGASRPHERHREPGPR